MKLKIVVIFFILAFTIYPTTDNSLTQNVLGYGGEIEINEAARVGSGYPSTNDVVVDGSYAYLAEGIDGVRILDISDKLNPIEISRIDIKKDSKSGHYIDGADTLHIEKSGDIIYTYLWAPYFHEQAFLHAYDVSDPANPMHIITEIGVFVKQMQTVGDLLYATTPFGFEIINTTRLSSGRIGYYNFPNGVGQSDARDIRVVGNFAYVALNTEGFLILNVVDPTAPTLVSHYNVTGTHQVQGIDVNGINLYLGNSTGGFEVFDVSTPSNPVFVSKLNLQVNKLVSSGNFVYTRSGSNLTVIDVSNPNLPLIKDTLVDVGSGGAKPVYVTGYVYIPASVDGLQIVNVADPNNILFAGEFNLPNQSYWHTTVHDNLIYAISDFNDVLNIYSISDINVPTSVGSLSLIPITNSSVYTIEYSNNFIFIGSQEGLIIVNVTNPAMPELTNFFTAVTFIRDIEISGNYIYLTNGNNQFLIYSMVDLTNLVFLDSGSFTTSATGQNEIVISGTTLYLRANGEFIGVNNIGIGIFDISNHTDVRTIGSINGPSHSIAIYEEFLFSSNDRLITVYDVSDPVSPTAIGSINKGTSNERYTKMVIRFPYLFAYSSFLGTTSGTEIHIFDISDPYDVLFKPLPDQDPWRTGFGPASIKDFAMQPIGSSYIIISTLYEGLVVYDWNVVPVTSTTTKTISTTETQMETEIQISIEAGPTETVTGPTETVTGPTETNTQTITEQGEELTRTEIVTSTDVKTESAELSFTSMIFAFILLGVIKFRRRTNKINK